ncbi:MAG: hypothetical protein ABJP34_05590 [Erythrobacter sp.]
MKKFSPVKEEREVISFWIKSISMILATIAALMFGVAHYNKLDTELQMIARLAGDTDLAIDDDAGFDYEKVDGDYCTISGQYRITNIGEYEFYGEEVELTLWELPYLTKEIEGKKVVGLAMSNRIDSSEGEKCKRSDASCDAISLDSFKIPVGENFAHGNQLQRSFQFIFEIDPTNETTKPKSESYYVVEANARVALESGEEGQALQCEELSKFWEDPIDWLMDPGICFNENDLRHMSTTLKCKPTPRPPPPPPKSSLPQTDKNA